MGDGLDRPPLPWDPASAVARAGAETAVEGSDRTPARLPPSHDGNRHDFATPAQLTRSPASRPLGYF